MNNMVIHVWCVYVCTCGGHRVVTLVFLRVGERSCADICVFI